MGQCLKEAFTVLVPIGLVASYLVLIFVIEECHEKKKQVVQTPVEKEFLQWHQDPQKEPQRGGPDERRDSILETPRHGVLLPDGRVADKER